ncbi:MAG: hypothetical protein COV47_01575 [Candidatus Diapherotrites archaeon CG11_big_fil_rev_8_21_14_0_20_37_9]|nr:MAG: hypothetical protein COV47_01575 [Candidatus Diapherotrites archaeon CG11_big_fil_rev_8_21_14_0_20_37_9]
MADVFVVFGSASDNNVFEPLLDSLKNEGISFEFRVLSAHKTPAELDSALKKTNAKIFIAGAGLSAALPGVIAAQKPSAPVIGIPCEGAYQGLDSFLSVAQMPPDVPVICVGVSRVQNAVALTNFYLSNLREIILVQTEYGDERKYFDKCKAFMEENGIPFNEGFRSEFSNENVFIEFVDAGKELDEIDCVSIRVPVKSVSSKEDALKVFDQMQGAYSVALNSYKNAAIIALQLINFSGKHDSLLKKLRKDAGKKVLEANK